MRSVVLVLLLMACADPERELAQCQVVVGDQADALGSCLIRLHDWDPDKARYAELHYIAEVNRKLRARRDSAP